MPGEAVIGAMGAMQKVPKYAADGSLQPHVVMKMSWCSLSCRHASERVLALFENELVLAPLRAMPVKLGGASGS